MRFSFTALALSFSRETTFQNINLCSEHKEGRPYYTPLLYCWCLHNPLRCGFRNVRHPPNNKFWDFPHPPFRNSSHVLGVSYILYISYYHHRCNCMLFSTNMFNRLNVPLHGQGGGVRLENGIGYYSWHAACMTNCPIPVPKPGSGPIPPYQYTVNIYRPYRVPPSEIPWKQAMTEWS